MKRLLQNAGHKLHAFLQDTEFKPFRPVFRSMIPHPADRERAKNGRTVIFTGPTRVGKTDLACTLTDKARALGFSCFYIRPPRNSPFGLAILPLGLIIASRTGSRQPLLKN